MPDKPKSELSIMSANADLIRESGIDIMLKGIRPHWQAKRLVERIKVILPADPSSACQRIFNASIHDLKEKLAFAGIDIVTEAARLNKLPPISKTEEIEQYTPYNTIGLALGIGLLTRSESRRLYRVYDIRKDLEHEDDEYEATVEDCIYIFKTCIDYVLSKDPIEIIRLADIKKVVEQPTPAALKDGVIEDYKHAPAVRQLEIHKFLISFALNTDKPDIVRQNCWRALQALTEHTQNQVRIDSSADFVQRIGRDGLDLLEARIAFAAGILPYLKRTQLSSFFKRFWEQMEKTGYSFRNHAGHRELLTNLEEVGGLEFCPDAQKHAYVEWLVLCYIGEPGGYGQGYSRRVFYSNVGAPLAFKLLTTTNAHARDVFNTLEKESKRVRSACINDDVSRRFEEIADALIG